MTRRAAHSVRQLKQVYANKMLTHVNLVIGSVQPSRHKHKAALHEYLKRWGGG